MKEQFLFLKKLISDSLEQNDTAEQALKYLNAIQKEMALMDFKYNRLVSEKSILANFLEQTSRDYEDKILELAQARDAAETSLTKINASLAYAKRIQKAVLGHTAQVKTLFPNSFVIYKPRDVISGDFFWTTHLKNAPFVPQKGFDSSSLKVIIVADCTGHGVSGAFLTLIGITHINDIIKAKDIHQPHLILQELDALVSISLHENNTNDQVRDGMDIGVMVFDEIHKKLYFAGAKQSLYVLREKELIRIQGNNYTIDGRTNLQATTKKFDLHCMDFYPNDVLYMYTDGAQDQFGGYDDKGQSHKLTSRKFKNLLLETQSKDLEDQKKCLQEELQKWRGTLAQTDDVLIIGMRIEQ